MTAFADTSFFVALLVKQDQWHSRAARASRANLSLVTSSLVINETISLLQARGHFSEALVFLREIRRDEQVEIFYPDAAVQSQAWEEFNRWGGMGANAVDCVSFTLMRKYSVRKALTFDAHFRMAGFSVAP
jgi:predicted nucleic acid-binding protein